VKVFTTGVWDVRVLLLSDVVWLSLLPVAVGPLVVELVVFDGWSAVVLAGSVVEVDESVVDVVDGSDFVVGLVSLVVEELSVVSEDDVEVELVEVVADDVLDVVVASVLVRAALLEVTAFPPPVAATLWPEVTANKDKEYKRNEKLETRMMGESKGMKPMEVDSIRRSGGG
jgi:hypothetical protein